VISRILARRRPAGHRPRNWLLISTAELRAVVQEVVRLDANTVEVIVKAPLAARSFSPDSSTLAELRDAGSPRQRTRLAMEGLALTARGSIASADCCRPSCWNGGSSDLCVLLKPGEPVILMVPRERPRKHPRERRYCGRGGLATRFYSRSAKAARGGQQSPVFRRIQEDGGPVQGGGDRARQRSRGGVVLRRGSRLPAGASRRPDFTGNIVEAIAAYGRGIWVRRRLLLDSASRLIVIGSDGICARCSGRGTAC